MNKPKFEVAVGFFVVIGFVIIAMVVFFVSGVYFFRDGYHVRAVFDYVGIINRGAPVRFSGVRVGEVSQVKVPTIREGDKPQIEITFFIEQGVVIKDHYQVSIRGNHIMSEPHIEITPLPGEGRILGDGDLIKGVSPYSTDQILEEFDSAAQKLNKLLGEATTAFRGTETRNLLFDSLKNMNQLLVSLNSITVGEEKEFRQLVERLNDATDQLTQLLRQINQGEGTLGKLVTEDEIYNDLRDFTSDIKKHPWKLFKKG